MARDAEIRLGGDAVSALELEAERGVAIGFAWSPAPHTSVCASSTFPDLSVTRVGSIDSTISPSTTSTPRSSRASFV